MPVSCLAIGDPHFQVSNVIEAEDLIHKLGVVVDKCKPTFIVILGDLLHTHEKIHVTPFNLATTLITGLAKRAKVFLIIGNHDYCNNQQFLTNKHPFNPFKKIKNIVVCDRVVYRMIGGNKFIFCPYTPPDRFEEALDTLEAKNKVWDDATCIFAHQEFYGCRFNPVMTSTEGDIWPEDYPLVVSGHIHNEQRLQSNIYYTGSSMQHAFGETEDKTVALLTFKGPKDFNLQKIDLEMRKKKIVYLHIDKVDDYSPPDNVYIKLVIKGSPEQFKVFRKGATFKRLQEEGISVSFAPDKTVNDHIKNVQKKDVIEVLKHIIEDEDEYIRSSFERLIE